MNIRQSIFFCILLGGMSLMTACSDTHTEKANFLFILVDDLGWADLGCYGSTFYETPNIDGLSDDGVRFTNAYAACPVCSPTRASIMTGKYPARMNTTDWFGAPQPENVHKHWTRKKPLLPAPYQEFLSLEETTIAEALKEAGYHTFFAGKWHLGSTEEYWPEKQGFDINIGGWLKGAPHTNKKKGYKGYFSPYGNPRLSDGPEGEHLPDRLARETAGFIDSLGDQPFFAYLSFYSVHTPLQSREDLINKYRKKKEEMGLEDRFDDEGERRVRAIQCHPVYAAMLESMDEAVGLVIKKLKEKGLYDNTVIIFMSDNGGLSTAERSPTCNYPLRAGKGWLYEGGIREPMIIKWKGSALNGRSCDSYVTSNDFYPTILELAGLPLKPEQHVDAMSFVPLLNNEESDRGPIFWHYPHYGNQGGKPGTAVRSGKWKLIEWYESGKLELFNLEVDPGEKNDLAIENAEIKEQLKTILDQWKEDLDARPVSKNPGAETE